MREREREIGLPRVGDGGEGKWEAKWIGERLLFLDELEETLEQAQRSGGESPTRVRALEARVQQERERFRRLEAGGALQYEEIERVMRQVDLSG